MKPETKSDFLRGALEKKPDLDYQHINRLWAKKGRPGEISNALYYHIRRELGIKTEWAWVRTSEPKEEEVSSSATGEVYQFKITLMDAKPPIWRRIQVMDCTLDKLHQYIQTAMGWTNSHLHDFEIGGKRYGDPFLMAENFDDMQYADSTTTRLSEIVPEGDQKLRFRYQYDFGDSWEHEVLFEGRRAVEKGKKYPICLKGARACPPEDVGGVWGYAEFLQAVADPDNDQHDELLEWVGGKFDPEAFDPARATREMKRGLPDWRSMM